MSATPKTPTTSIATEANNDVFVRGKSLCRELIGELNFTEMLFFQILGRVPNAAETTMVDACLVTLVEHGLTPSALSTRSDAECAEHPFDLFEFARRDAGRGGLWANRGRQRVRGNHGGLCRHPS